MTRPVAGRLPFSITKATNKTVRKFIPISAFNGVVGNGVWQPASTGDTVTYVLYDDKIDVASAVNVSVLWSTNNTTTTNSATFRALYSALTLNTTAVSVGGTALDTTITSDAPVSTANALLETPQGVLAAGTLTDGQALSLALNVSAVSGLTLGAASSDRICVYGV